MKETETIHSDIPLPKQRRGAISKWEKFKSMEVGQCVFVNSRIDANALKVYLERAGMTVVTRKVDDQIGIWRVADE